MQYPQRCFAFILVLFCLVEEQNVVAINVQDIPIHPATTSCTGYDCVDKVWCTYGANVIDIQKIFSDVTFHLNFDNVKDTCVIIESDDSTYSKETFAKTNGTTACNRIDRMVSPSFAESWLYATKILSHCDDQNSCTYSFSPYLQSCIKLCPSMKEKDIENMTLTISSKTEHKKKHMLVLFAIGLVLVCISGNLSERFFFYYATGVSMGVFLSVFLMTFFILKRVKGSSSVLVVGIAAGAQSVLGLLTFASEWLKELLEAHWEYVVIYVAIATLISLAVVHYNLSGKQTISTGMKDIVRWMINVVGITLIMFSTKSARWSIVMAITTLCCIILKAPVQYVLSYCSDRPAPPRRFVDKFLTEEEYKAQGEICTEAAMEKLVATPEFQSWIKSNSHRISITPMKVQFGSDE